MRLTQILSEIVTPPNTNLSIEDRLVAIERKIDTKTFEQKHALEMTTVLYADLKCERGVPNPDPSVWIEISKNSYSLNTPHNIVLAARFTKYRTQFLALVKELESLQSIKKSLITQFGQRQSNFQAKQNIQHSKIDIASMPRTLIFADGSKLKNLYFKYTSGGYVGHPDNVTWSSSRIANQYHYLQRILKLFSIPPLDMMYKSGNEFVATNSLKTIAWQKIGIGAGAKNIIHICPLPPKQANNLAMSTLLDTSVSQIKKRMMTIIPDEK